MYVPVGRCPCFLIVEMLLLPRLTNFKSYRRSHYFSPNAGSHYLGGLTKDSRRFASGPAVAPGVLSNWSWAAIGGTVVLLLASPFALYYGGTYTYKRYSRFRGALEHSLVGRQRGLLGRAVTFIGYSCGSRRAIPKVRLRDKVSSLLPDAVKTDDGDMSDRHVLGVIGFIVASVTAGYLLYHREWLLSKFSQPSVMGRLKHSLVDIITRLIVYLLKGLAVLAVIALVGVPAYLVWQFFQVA